MTIIVVAIARIFEWKLNFFDEFDLDLKQYYIQLVYILDYYT